MSVDRELLQEILDRASTDAGFRDALLTDPHQALSGVGMLPELSGDGLTGDCDVTCTSGVTCSPLTCDVTCKMATCSAGYTI